MSATGWCVSNRLVCQQQVPPGVSATGQRQVSQSLLGIRQERPHEDIKVVVDGPDELFRELRDVLVPRKRLPQMHRYVFRKHICEAYASTRQHRSAHVSTHIYEFRDGTCPTRATSTNASIFSAKKNTHLCGVHRDAFRIFFFGAGCLVLRQAH